MQNGFVCSSIINSKTIEINNKIAEDQYQSVRIQN